MLPCVFAPLSEVAYICIKPSALARHREEAARLESRAATLGSLMGSLQKDLDAELASRRSDHEHLVSEPVFVSRVLGVGICRSLPVRA